MQEVANCLARDFGVRLRAPDGHNLLNEFMQQQQQHGRNAAQQQPTILAQKFLTTTFSSISLESAAVQNIIDPAPAVPVPRLHRLNQLPLPLLVEVVDVVDVSKPMSSRVQQKIVGFERNEDNGDAQAQQLLQDEGNVNGEWVSGRAFPAVLVTDGANRFRISSPYGPWAEFLTKMGGGAVVQSMIVYGAKMVLKRKPAAAGAAAGADQNNNLPMDKVETSRDVISLHGPKRLVLELVPVNPANPPLVVQRLQERRARFFDQLKQGRLYWDYVGAGRVAARQNQQNQQQQQPNQQQQVQNPAMMPQQQPVPVAPAQHQHQQFPAKIAPMPQRTRFNAPGPAAAAAAAVAAGGNAPPPPAAAQIRQRQEDEQQQQPQLMHTRPAQPPPPFDNKQIHQRDSGGSGGGGGGKNGLDFLADLANVEERTMQATARPKIKEKEQILAVETQPPTQYGSSMGVNSNTNSVVSGVVIPQSNPNSMGTTVSVKVEGQKRQQQQQQQGNNVEAIEVDDSDDDDDSILGLKKEKINNRQDQDQSVSPTPSSHQQKQQQLMFLSTSQQHQQQQKQPQKQPQQVGVAPRLTNRRVIQGRILEVVSELRVITMSDAEIAANLHQQQQQGTDGSSNNKHRRLAMMVRIVLAGPHGAHASTIDVDAGDAWLRRVLHVVLEDPDEHEVFFVYLESYYNERAEAAAAGKPAPVLADDLAHLVCDMAVELEGQGGAAGDLFFELYDRVDDDGRGRVTVVPTVTGIVKDRGIFED